MTSPKHFLIYFIFAIAFMGLGVWLHQSSAPTITNSSQTANHINTVIGQPAPSFSLKDTNDQLRTLSEWQGKILVINFWATWCSSCRHEIPMFIQLQDKLSKQGLQFVGVTIQTAKEVIKYTQSQEITINYPLLVEQHFDLYKDYGNYAKVLPFTVVVAADGSIRYTKHGMILEAELLAQVQPLLDELHSLSLLSL